jgi:NAD(P)-dependent dehydrogenase (short-subunit alcohol dehydrogenase family)
VAIEAAIDAFGRLDCLVNNAGDGGPTKAIEDYSLEEWQATVASCLTTSFLCAHFAVPKMMAAGGGAIVNISSMAGRRGLANRAGYCAAKAGQVGLTYGLAAELGRHNITVNAIVPGAVEGERIDRMIAARATLTGATIDDVRRTFLARSPLGRMVTADDIAGAAAFLCSDQARNISGQAIPITAGEPA